MSQQERNEWTDDGALDAEPIEGFADLDDDYSDEEIDVAAPAEDAATAREQDEVAEKPAPAATPVRGKRGISSFELGFLFTASILVAAAGVGSACLLAVGASPASLWQPSELMTWQNYLNLDGHPLNLLALIVAGTVVLTLLGSGAIARAAKGANNRFRSAESVLSRLTALRLDDEAAWQAADFPDHAPAAKFAAETLGTWRLLGARQKRYMGLEGELHRLEKALSDGSRTDLTGRFDNPAVGALSDAIVRYFDEHKSLTAELAERRERDEAESAALISLLQDARGWNRTAREQLGAQSVAVDSLARRQGEAPAGEGVAAVATELTALTAQFQTQAERLVKLGQGIAELTGTTFDADEAALGSGDNPPEMPLAATRQDPFAGMSAPEPVGELDPFAGGDEPVGEDTPEPAAPVVETAEPAAPVGEAGDGLIIEGPFAEREVDVVPAVSVDEEAPLPDGGEKVYDLDNFGAEPVVADESADPVPAPEAVADEPAAEEPVADLADFGAVALDAPAEEEVHDLSEFGAVRLDGPGGPDEDRIYDLAEFGAERVS